MLNKAKLLFLPLICALLSAGTAVLVKAINGSMDSIALGMVRLVITALVLMPIVFIKKEYAKVSRADIGWFLLIGVIGYCLNTVFYFSALLHAPALNVALINVLVPLLSLLLCFLFFKMVPSRRELIAFVVAFVGVVLVITEGRLDMDALIDSYGEFLALSSSVCWVLYTMIIWHLRGRYAPSFIACVGSIIGATCIALIVWWQGSMLQTLYVLDDHWAAVAYIGILGTSLLYLLYIRSVELIGPNLTTFGVYSIRPLAVAVLAYFYLGSPVSWWQAVGGLLIVGSMYLVIHGDSGAERVSRF